MIFSFSKTHTSILSYFSLIHVNTIFAYVYPLGSFHYVPLPLSPLININNLPQTVTNDNLASKI